MVTRVSAVHISFMRRPVRNDLLQEKLDALVATFDVSTITPDPLELVLRYTNPLDQEVAGLIAAAFAYGRADTVVANVTRVLDRMTPAPHEYLRTYRRAEATKRFKGFSHRFHKTPELVAFLDCIATTIKTHGSIGALFRQSYRDDEKDIGPSLARFVEHMREGGQAGLPVLHRKALQYLLTSPNDGSACKRMNLFLRWMVRRTSPDLGIWDFVDPAKLVMPVDTHIHRIATFLGINNRKTADWKAARAITNRLARFDRADPVRYDFAICRLGILDLCSRKRRKSNCDVCLLRECCRFPVQ
jgi:uncharacterized protein (TIGR02757 family)